MILDCLNGPRVIAKVLIRKEKGREYGSERETERCYAAGFEDRGP